MHRATRALVVGLVAGLAAPALATNGMRMTGFGAVQNGMGGVGVAASLDASSALANPAGLSDLGRRFDASLTWFQPTVEYKATGIAPPFVNQGDVTFKSNRGGSPIPNLGVVLPLGNGLTAGLGAYGVGGMGVDYDANLFSGVTLTSYSNLRVAPALAWKPSELVSVGLAANLSWAQMKYDVASGFGQVPHDTANSFGWGYTVGVKFHPVKTLAVGASWESRSEFQDFEFTIPQHQAPDGAGGVVTVPGGTDKLRFHQPSVLAFGVAWQPAQPLLVAADVEVIGWRATSGPGLPEFKNNTQLTGALPFNMSWSDQTVYKVGVQYLVTPAWTARAGWNYGKNPLDQARAFENVAFPAIAEHHLALGLGWAASETLAVNLGATYAPKVTLSGANASPPPTGQGISAYQTSMSQVAVDLGVGWKF